MATKAPHYDNRLLGVAGGSVSATFLYDADGNRAKGTVAGVTTVYLAGLYEWQNGAVTKYYEGGALRRTGYATDNGVFYVVSDHLRSTSVLVNRDGTVKNRNYYYPYGGNRGGSAFSGLTTKRFTGQYHEAGLPGGEGLSYYNARWYDSQLGVFISADTIVPSPLSPQSLNRYAYVGGNPTAHADPSGHSCDDGPQTYAACYGKKTSSQGIIRAASMPGGAGTATYSQARSSARYKSSYLFSSAYGWIDRGHASTGLAEEVIRRVTGAVLRGGDEVILPPQPVGPKVLGQHVLYYERRYTVSSKVTPEQITGVALGIYQDAGKRWEEWQGKFGMGSSRYAIEDLPSNYLGFVRTAYGWSEEYTYGHLGALTPTDDPPTCKWSGCSGPSQPLPRNTEHQPIIMAGNRWTYTNWPDALSMTPIASSPSTWQFTGASTYPFGRKDFAIPDGSEP